MLFSVREVKVLGSVILGWNVVEILLGRLVMFNFIGCINFVLIKILNVCIWLVYVFRILFLRKILVVGG